ncbi:MAG: Photosystem I reaction center subunit III [Microcoleus sp. PH2017_10_PVI_O_A]|uniref:Photosystem I reaction center subunit III n=1 Tax=unclassified Microcoleus TaxID=2642155 RepID=UPI001D90C45A|nr:MULTISPECIES: Photosystem I reaction center subunit III [unclassified Microcoleus]TAE78836.1 MAG: Photosystem I reaction center subunit III [Oscillatoriales cyanobacterium]MCC3408651.1 Photosystem I reaction center subunit III [Microcoleus sp. PH2017_10_PVI_O_A]MCC3462738.1 Photosystem I reaction center subunit III [Microcoleus sp. PH2017_11_PCY_U_A]MCC3481199.1 Photosystem I reaction center subunit III [Microcoleus sp. PH2017_12_PCY_D_A]MCC3531638.1 Photosystem I reaction center subunit II
MRRLFAAILVVSLWFSSATVASAYNLVPCKDSPEFKELAKNARSTNGDPASAKARFERYSQAMCGPEGYPHLIVDGSLDKAGDFLIPSVLFLYIAGWIGWVGRSYLQVTKKSATPEEKEIIIDVPLAIKCMLSGVLWPLAALTSITSGEMFAKDDEITVSPR